MKKITIILLLLLVAPLCAEELPPYDYMDQARQAHEAGEVRTRYLLQQLQNGEELADTPDDGKPLVLLQVNGKNCGKGFEGEPGVARVKWVSDDHLRVNAWSHINYQTDILERGAGMVLEGDTLYLTYKVKISGPDEDGQVPACMRPVRVQFDILGIPRGDYKVGFRETTD